MPRNIIEINGKVSFLNYASLRQSFEEEAIARDCENSTIYLFNEFPITSTEAPIDLVFILNIKEEDGNFLRFNRRRETTYIRNVIIPIRCIDIYQNDTFILENGNGLLIEENEIDITHELSAMKFGLKHFLHSNCSFEDDCLFIYPLIFFKSKRFNLLTETFIVDKELDWKNIFLFIQNQALGFKYISSYLPWSEKNNYELSFQTDIKKCIDVASSISSKNGYLSKRKLDRIAKQLAKKLDVFDHIGERLVVIEGKAGTGKTNELLALMMYVLSKGRNAKYLTYNNLLVFDVAQLFYNHSGSLN